MLDVWTPSQSHRDSNMRIHLIVYFINVPHVCFMFILFVCF